MSVLGRRMLSVVRSHAPSLEFADGAVPHSGDVLSAGRDRRVSQRQRLLLLLLGITIPMVALAAILLYTSIDEARSRARREMSALAQSGALATEWALNGHVRTLAAIGTHLRDAPGRSEPDVRRQLLAALEANPEFDGISVARADGVVIAGSRATSAGADLSERPYFRRLMETGEPVVSDGVRTLIEDVPAVLVAMPLPFDDGTQGALAGSVTLTDLSSILADTLSGRALLALVDSSGQTLVHRDEEGAATLVNVADRPEVQAGFRGESGTMEVARGGQQLLVAFASVPGLQWVVTVAEETHIAYSPADAIRDRGAFFILLTASSVMMGGWALGGRLNQSYAAIQEARRAEAAARERAELALGSRDEFLAIASHELRNPVTAIRGLGQLMQRRLREGTLPDKDLRDYVDRIAGSGVHLSRLVEDLLNVSRLEGGHLDLQFAAVDLVDLVRFAATEASVPDGVLRVVAPPEPLIVSVDVDRITQILVNLIENAVKYSSNGAGILVSVKSSGAQVVLAVRDQGTGLSEKDIAELFKPFARGANAQRENVPGLGLGLYLSRRLAQAHGGSLTVSSPGEGLGSTFTLTLPADVRAVPLPDKIPAV